MRTSFNVTKLKDNIKEEEAEPTDFDNTTLVNFRNNQKNQYFISQFCSIFHYVFCMYNMAPLKLNSVILVFVGTAHFEPLGHLKSLAFGGADDKGLLW